MVGCVTFGGLMSILFSMIIVVENNVYWSPLNMHSSDGLISISSIDNIISFKIWLQKASDL